MLLKTSQIKLKVNIIYLSILTGAEYEYLTPEKQEDITEKRIL